jgi:hypothetical protein
LCDRRFFRLRGGGDTDEGAGDEDKLKQKANALLAEMEGEKDEDAGKSPEGLYLSSNRTGYKGVYKQTTAATFMVKVKGGNVCGFNTKIEAARMYKRIWDGELTVAEAEAKMSKAKLEAQKTKLEAELEEIQSRLAALE